MENNVLLPLTYLGPLQLYCRYFESANIFVEQYDTYQKQSYRNRCDIYGANGRLSLIIPVKHEKGKRLKVKDVRIDYATDWRRLHWKGIESAYNSSPYFEYYRDIFDPYYRKEFVFLIDICMSLNEEILNILGISARPKLTEKYVFSEVLTESIDLRSIIHPKENIENDPAFRIVEYTQVFSHLHGFQANLSVLDLVFNMGPESGKVLQPVRS